MGRTTLLPGAPGEISWLFQFLGASDFLGLWPRYPNLCRHHMASPLCVSGQISLSKCSHILRSSGLGLQHMPFGGHDSAHDRWIRSPSVTVAPFPGQVLSGVVTGRPHREGRLLPPSVDSSTRGLAAHLQKPRVFTHSCNEGGKKNQEAKTQSNYSLLLS